MSEEEQEQSKKQLALVQAHVAQLGEHFDTVQIFCTKHEPGLLDGTINIGLGSGNIFARIGQCSLWVEMQKQFTRTKADQDQRSDGDRGGL